MENTNKSLDLKFLLLGILRRWRMIVVVTVVTMLIFGGYKIVSGVIKARDMDSVKKSMVLYEQQKNVYEAQTEALNLEIEQGLSASNLYSDYIKNLESAGIDLNDATVLSSIYYVDAGYEIILESSTQNINPTVDIINTYRYFSNNETVLSQLDEVAGSELINTRSLFNVSLLGNSLLEITVIHSDKNISSEIMKILSDFIEGKTDEISNVVAEHTITYLGTSTYDIGKSYFTQELETHGEQSKTSFKSTSEALVNLNALTPPTKPNYSISAIIKSSIKFMIVGAVAGIFVSIIFALILDMMDDKIRYKYDIKNQYNKVYLGTYVKK